MSLKNQTALITGAASGIGRAIALRFAQAGATVIIADLDEAKAKKTADEIAAQTSSRCLAVAMDVGHVTSVNAAFEQLGTQVERLDIVVNNAGIQIIAPLMDFAVADWHKVMDIHLNGGFYISQQAMRWMRDVGVGGKILFIGSVHSYLASLNKAAYVAAKHAQMGLMRAIAKEGASYHIASHLIAPGFVKTPLVEKQIPEQAQRLGISAEEVVKNIMLSQTVDGEFTSAEEVAEVALFFAAFKGLALTGQSLLVSHGWVMD